MDFAPVFSGALAYDEFLTQFGTAEHRRRWAQTFDRVRLSGPQQELLAHFRREMHVLCVAGAWCGDCVNQCPIFEHFVRANPVIQVRYIDRDAQAEVSSHLKICGGARVPVVVFLNEEDQFVGLYGDRTLAKYRLLAEALESAACPTGIVAEEQSLLDAVTDDWLREFERVQWLLRVSPRLREKHGD